MTDQERTQAVTALIQWFESQDIMPPDAVLIVTELIAMQLVLKNRDLDVIGAGMATHMTYLALQIEECLKIYSKN